MRTACSQEYKMTDRKRSVEELAQRLKAIPPDPSRSGSVKDTNPFVFSDAALQGQLERGNHDFITSVSDLVLDIQAARTGTKTLSKDALWTAVEAERARKVREDSPTMARHLFNVIVDDVIAGTHMKNRLV